MELQLSATWILEIVASILSIMCLSGLIGVLKYADGRVVVAWHGGLTLNTIISILGTGSKLCAMFALGAAIAQSKWAIFSRHPRSLAEFEAVEQAGRGPFGAAKLLVMTRKVATIGAIAVLLSLFFDPSAQQLVQFKQEITWQPSLDATLPKAERYSAGNRVPVELLTNLTRAGNVKNDEVNTAVIMNPDFNMQSSILYGLTKPVQNVTQQLALNCPSGNCTWPVTETLGVCHKCNDLRSAVAKSTMLQSPGYLEVAAIERPHFPENLTRYSLPNGAWLDNVDGQTPYFLMTSFGTGNVDSTASMKEVDTLVWSTTFLRVPKDSEKKLWPFEIEATECALYYCVKAYNTSVTNGTISQTFTINSNAKRVSGSWEPINTFNTVLNGTEKQTLEFDRSQSRITRTDLMLGDKYNISQTAVDGTSYYFENNFANTDIVGVEGLNGYYINQGASSEADDQYDYAPSAMDPLYHSTDFEESFASLAESMSNIIRAGGDGRMRVMGKAGLPVTKFNVSWPWIALPAAVILLAVGQLLVTMWTSRNVPLWKGSTLATMSRGPYIGDVLLEAETVQDMHKAVEGQPIHLFSHTAPGGVAVVANSRQMVAETEKHDVQISVAEIAERVSPTQIQCQRPPKYSY